ncbi:MAG: GNAT family N-acetyltransferase [Betaproteobacteria bacterium]
MHSLFSVRRADWDLDVEKIRGVRETVFVLEQNVPVELEWDGIDVDCAHMLAESPDGSAIGTGRLLPDGHIGRMAVLQAWRGNGVGAKLLLELVALAAERGLREVVLNAQTHALGFYELYGFAAFGDEFLDAGIPHRSMRRVF